MAPIYTRYEMAYKELNKQLPVLRLNRRTKTKTKNKKLIGHLSLTRCFRLSPA